MTEFEIAMCVFLPLWFIVSIVVSCWVCMSIDETKENIDRRRKEHDEMYKTYKRENSKSLNIENQKDTKTREIEHGNNIHTKS